MVVEEDEKPYNVHLKAQPNSERLGKRLKGELRKVSAAINGKHVTITHIDLVAAN